MHDFSLTQDVPELTTQVNSDRTKNLNEAAMRLRVFREIILDLKNSRNFSKYAKSRIGDCSTMSSLKSGQDTLTFALDKPERLVHHFSTAFLDASSSSDAPHLPRGRQSDLPLCLLEHDVYQFT